MVIKKMYEDGFFMDFLVNVKVRGFIKIVIIKDDFYSTQNFGEIINNHRIKDHDKKVKKEQKVI